MSTWHEVHQSNAHLRVLFLQKPARSEAGAIWSVKHHVALELLLLKWKSPANYNAIPPTPIPRASACGERAGAICLHLAPQPCLLYSCLPCGPAAFGQAQLVVRSWPGKVSFILCLPLSVFRLGSHYTLWQFWRKNQDNWWSQDKTYGIASILVGWDPVPSETQHWRSSLFSRLLSSCY